MDALANGRKFRTVNLKDDCTRECPAIDVALSTPGSRVVEMLERVARELGYPDVLTVDNGPEFRGRALDGPLSGMLACPAGQRGGRSWRATPLY